MSSDRVEKLIALSKSLFHSTERQNMENLWGEIAEFILPSQFNLFNSQATPGQKRTTRLFDSTAIQANHDLSAAINSTLTNPASQWADLKFKSEELNDDSESIEWLEDSNNKVHGALNESNFYAQLGKAYQSISSFGTMSLFHEDAEAGGETLFQGFRFKAIHLGELAIAEDADGRVNTVCRRFKLTARQALDRFEEHVSDSIKQAVENNKDFAEFEFVLIIRERDKKDVRLNEFGLAPPATRPYSSVIIEVKAKSIVEENGYYEFPVPTARWQTMPGEVYGRSPAHIALPDVRTLNKLVETTLKYTEKVTNPPILATERGMAGNLVLTPGYLNIVKSLDAIKAFVPEGRPDIANFKTEELKESIRNTFFLNRIFLPDRTQIGEMTATETLRRIEQTQKVLGSTWGVLNSFLSDIIVRSFKMMYRGGALLPLPEQLREVEVDVDVSFINSLARAQQSDDIANIEAWVQGIAELAQIKPEVLDVIDADAVARHIAKIRNVPEIAITDKSVVKEIRESRNEQAQATQELDNELKRADVASKLIGAGGIDDGSQ